MQEQQSLLLSMTQPRLNILGSSPSAIAAATASVSVAATPPQHHRRTPPASANLGYHAEKPAGGARKDKSL